MNAFESLLNISAEEKKARGLEHTPKEIAQQPATWAKAAEMLQSRSGEIGAFLDAAGLTGNNKAHLILSGAGSSEFVGNAVAPGLRKRLKRTVTSVSTTNIVTHPDIFIPGENYVVLSFARSGNSPESMATYHLVKQMCSAVRQIAITCNKDGALAQATKKDCNSLYVELPEETNDKSLVMTSSFTTMAFTALGLGMLGSSGEMTMAAAAIGAAGKRVMGQYGDLLKNFADQPFTRACFLGSGPLNGTMQECHLKLQEMTEGRVVSMYNSFVGLRHGPQVFVNKECAVVAALSSDAYVRKYELDMLRELSAKKQGCGEGPLVICDRATPEIGDLAGAVVELFPDGGTVDDDLRIMTDTMVGQILGTFTSLRCGLKPDNPSVSGTISRVVQGVTIYDYTTKR
jgi:tagatose-6-phosphate ketose/aldose isomerase